MVDAEHALMGAHEASYGSLFCRSFEVALRRCGFITALSWSIRLEIKGGNRIAKESGRDHGHGHGVTQYEFRTLQAISDGFLQLVDGKENRDGVCMPTRG